MPQLSDGRCILCGEVRGSARGLVEHFVFAHEHQLTYLEGFYGLGLGWIGRARTQDGSRYLADPFADGILNAIPRP